MTLDTDNNGL